MSAYIIVEVEVNDPTGYAEYKELAQASVLQHGGKYLARGGKAENLEGNWEPKRLVILEFPTYDQAKNWLNSAEYAPGRALRQKYATSKMVVVQGVE